MEKVIEKRNIQFFNRVSNWQEGVVFAAEPLLQAHVITDNYIQAMIKNVEKFGDYIVLVPNVALPHARPEFGVNETGISFLVLRQPVSFGSGKKVQLIICLATKDNQEHLLLLQLISELIDEDDKVNRLIACKDAETFIAVVETILKEGEQTND